MEPSNLSSNPLPWDTVFPLVNPTRSANRGGSSIFKRVSRYVKSCLLEYPFCHFVSTETHRASTEGLFTKAGGLTTSPPLALQEPETPVVDLLSCHVVLILPITMHAHLIFLFRNALHYPGWFWSLRTEYSAAVILFPTTASSVAMPIYNRWRSSPKSIVWENVLF